MRSHVDLVETHISQVFLTRDRAYKVKKPVQMPFLDYRTLEARRDFCVEEVRLNRRLAPELYLGVRALVPAADGSGCELAPFGAEGAVDYVVEMRRIDPQQTLAARIAAGSATDADIDAVAARIAAFHATAERAGDAAPFGDQLRAALEAMTAGGGSRALAEAVLRLHERCRRELAERAARGLVRDGHGDLRAEHVVMGEPLQVFDCVEFDPALRRIDVGADLGFLVMDLERLGEPGLACALVASYERHGGDAGSPDLQALFAAYRACVRASVAGLRARQLDGAEREAALHEAAGDTRLAWRFVWRSHLPLVLVVCGPPATGKTTLAAEIADLAGIPRLSSDLIRRELGLRTYTPPAKHRVYTELVEQAAREPAGAVLDATFGSRAYRDALADALEREPLFAECSAGERTVAERASRQRPDSDAELAVAAGLAVAFEPLDEIPPERRLRVLTEQELAGEMAEVERFVATARRAGAGPALAPPGAALTRPSA